MIVFSAGRKLEPGDLNIIVRDENGVTFVPFSIVYSIFQVTDAGNVLVSNPGATPTPGAVDGVFYVNMTIPTIWSEGSYIVRWDIVRNSGDAVVQITEDFRIVAFRPNSTQSLDAASMLMVGNPEMTLEIADLVVSVRELLSDTNPDRNYHFRPPSAGKTVAGYSSRVGYIWTDTTIIRLLRITINQLNTYNPKAMYHYTLGTLPENWKGAVAIGAAAKCLSAESARWTADEFGYSLNGVSLDINKASQYQQLGEAYRSELEAWLPSLTANRPAARGLRQHRWLI